MPAGAAQIVLLWRGRAVSKPYPVRVIPRTPTTPRILRLSDGVELGRLNIVTCGWLKVWLSDVEDPTQLSITVGSLAASEVIFSCEDKWACRYQVNVRIPDAVPTGETVLAIQAGHVDLPPARFLLVRD